MDWAKSPIVEESETDFSTTFSQNTEDSSLEVMRLCEKQSGQEDAKGLESCWDHGLYFEGELNRLAVSPSGPWTVSAPGLIATRGIFGSMPDLLYWSEKLIFKDPYHSRCIRRIPLCLLCLYTHLGFLVTFQFQDPGIRDWACPVQIPPARINDSAGNETRIIWYSYLFYILKVC
jgi:hypothetical protein